MRLALSTLALLAGAAAVSSAQAPVSAPLSNIRYDVTYTRATAAGHSLHVEMTFDVGGNGPVLLSLPDWTPGAYEITNFARWVSGFDATAGGRPLDWDRLDYDTWRIQPSGARQIAVGFDYLADSLDNAIAWTRPDFAFFNGTNVFLYPEGRSMQFPATVRIHTEPGWLVATGMHSGSEAGTYTEGDYHDLVDMPFFIGRFDYDSSRAGGLTMRLATYPAGTLAGNQRDVFWTQYRKLFAPQSAVFGETPYQTYTTLMVFDSAYGGGSALEHQNSHLGIYTPQGIGQPWLTSVTAHEMFHAFNVKRMRPADMVPYRYDQSQPTPWLWVSEGITDYYADLTLVRAGLVDSAAFLNVTSGKIATVDNSPAVALEDASLATWIHPTDGTGYLYYPKGSLAGFMLDIMIRDASDNRLSLDDVMQQVYRQTYKQGRGFGATEWWGAVSRDAGGASFTAFDTAYVDGRSPYPWDSLLPRAGLRLVTDTVRSPRIGVNTTGDSAGVRIVSVVPGSVADSAGVQAGDVLVSVGDIAVNAPDAFDRFRSEYASKEDQDLPLHILRGGQPMTLRGVVRLVANVRRHIEPDPKASPKAVRIRHGIFTGR